MIWFDGRVSDDPRVPFDLRDRGLTLADGLFETVLAVGGKAFRLNEHLARLEAGARVLRLAADLERVGQAATDLAQATSEAVSIRITVTRGVGPRGLAVTEDHRPTIFASASPWRPELVGRPQRLATSVIRRNASSPLSRLKSLAYLDNVLALDEAVRSGVDDALLLSTDGSVACTSAGNLFAVSGDQLVTPPVADGVLPGVTRALVLSVAEAGGLAGVERSLSPNDLTRIDALFSTNSLRLLSPVSALDGRSYASAEHTGVKGLLGLLRAAIERECGTALPLS